MEHFIENCLPLRCADVTLVVHTNILHSFFYQNANSYNYNILSPGENVATRWSSNLFGGSFVNYETCVAF